MLGKPVEADPASVVTTIAPRANGAAIRKQITSAADTVPPIPRDRASLVRELQRELRRVGCYDGRLNESWTASTRTAMKAFTNRVNASLPIDRPDHILLTLVRGHQGRACGIACPPRQSLTHEGRCVPTAIFARANQKSLQRKTTLPGGEKQTTSVIASWSAVVTAPTTPENPGEGRMMLAGPLEKQGKTSAMAPVATAPMNPGRALTAPHRDFAKTQHVRADLLQEARFPSARTESSAKDELRDHSRAFWRPRDKRAASHRRRGPTSQGRTLTVPRGRVAQRAFARVAMYLARYL